MSRRLQLDETRRNLTAAEQETRRKQESCAFELGWPATPEYLWNDRPTFDAWKLIGKRLLEKRLLAFSDGEALLAVAKAQKNHQQEVCKQIYADTWANRTPFPDPRPPAEFRLDEFIASVKRERETFSQRMVPTQTVCLVNGQNYTWPEGKPAAIARTYALEVTAGTIVAGELLRRACARFLKDLEDGHTRGLYFDPVAAAHISTWCEIFCGTHLMPWEMFVLANVFGWKRPAGNRRFTEVYLQVAKKNGKTFLAASIALFGLVADSEQFSDVFSVATKRDQARLVWRDAKRMVLANSELHAAVKCWAGALAVPGTDSTFSPLSADTRSLDGLRPHFAIFDEVAEYPDAENFSKVAKGTVSRVQPLVFSITTPGATKNSFCYRSKYDLAQKLLRGIFVADDTFAVVYELDPEDDYHDQSTWCKANPSLGVTLKIEHLQKQLAECEQDPSALNNFLRYHMGQWIEHTLNRAGSIPSAVWDKCKGLELVGASNALEACTNFLLLNSGADTPCFVGVDVGLTGDTTAVAMLWPRARFEKDGPIVDKKVVIVQGFIPEGNLLAKEGSWGMPLSQLARESWIDLTPGDMTDPREIRKYVVDLHSRLCVREVGFDNWQFQVPAAELNDAGIKAVAVPQTAMHLTAPCRDFVAAVHAGDLVHFGNPWLAWHAQNVVFVENEKHGGVKPEKLSPNEKIDCISAIANAWARMLANPYVPSVYANRGIIFV